MDWLPLVGLAPDQLPEAAQLVAFAEFQLSIDEAPVATLPGLAVSETDGGAGGIPTATVTVWLASPPAPEQVSVKSLVAFSGPVASEPFTALLPDQPPPATQLAALVVLHASVEPLPAITDAGAAVSVTVGAAIAATATFTVWLVVPPVPVQVSVNDEAATRGPVEALADSAWLPDHPPDATQLDASVELQVSVDACPEPTVVGLALNVTLGAATGWLTLTETVRATLPPVPAQVSVKSVGAPRALLDSLPLTGLLPVQPPEAVQVDASAALQTRFVGCPLATSDGVAVRLTNGVGNPPASGDELSPAPPQAVARRAQASAAVKVRMGVYSLQNH